MQDKNIQLLKCIRVFLCYCANTVPSNLLTFISMWVCTMQMVEDIAEFGFERAEKIPNSFLIQSQTSFFTMALKQRPLANNFQGAFR